MQKKSTISKGELPSAEELWTELQHDYDVYGDRTVAADYQKRMSKFLKKKGEQTF